MNFPEILYEKSTPLASIRAIKRAVYNGLKSDLRGHMDYMSSQLGLLTQTDEHREAVKQFVEKDECKKDSDQ